MDSADTCYVEQQEKWPFTLKRSIPTFEKQIRLCSHFANFGSKYFVLMLSNRTAGWPRLLRHGKRERVRMRGRGELSERVGTNLGGGKYGLKISLICLSFCFQDLSSRYKLRFSSLDPNLKREQTCTCVELNFSSFKLIVFYVLKHLSQKH